MSLPSFDRKDDIPEPFRSSYVERDGKWVPDDSGEQGLKESQRRLLAEKKKADEELSRLRQAFGDLKPEEIADIIKAHRTTEEEQHKKAGEYDKLLEKRMQEIRAEYEPKIKAGEAAERALQAMRFEAAVRDAAAEAGVIAKKMPAVLKIVRDDHLRLKGDKVVVVDKDGDESAMTVEKFFSERFRTDYPEFYAGSGAAGGSATQSSSASASLGGAGRAGTVSATDNAAFLANIDGIASGKVRVTAPADG